MRCRVGRWRLHRRNDLELADIAKLVRPVLTGWVTYYGRFYPSKLQEELRTIDVYIVRWATRKYKRFQGHTMAIWDCSHIGAWDQRPDDRSRMNREVHVRFWESAGLQCPAPLDYRQEYRDLADARACIERFLEKV